MSAGIIGGADGPTAIFLTAGPWWQWAIWLAVLAVIVTCIVVVIKKRRKK